MEIRRKVKNVVYKYSEAERIVREATSNDPWGPSSTTMSQIADMTHNYHAFDDIMQLLWKRLNDKGKNWRHVYKSLVLLEYLIKCGDDRVANECKANIHTIQTLKDFQYFEEHKDHGTGIREKSKQLVSMLNDNEILDMEKEKGKKVKEKFHKPNSALGSHQRRRPGDLGREIKKQYNKEAHYPKSVMKLNFDDSKNDDDDDADFQKAIELSKEEHERTMKKKLEEEKREELKLKLALEQSKKEEEELSNLRMPPPLNRKSRSKIDDRNKDISVCEENKLAKLTEASRVFEQLNGDLNKLDNKTDTSITDPWGGIISDNYSKQEQNEGQNISLDFDSWASNTNSSTVPNNNINNKNVNILDSWPSMDNSKISHNNKNNTIVDDIFGDEKPNFTSTHLNFDSNAFDSNIDHGASNNNENNSEELFDPWGTAALTDPKIKEPRNVNTGSLASLNDLNNFGSEETMQHSLSVMDLANKKGKTPQEFLGENAKLVNLDNLVPTPKAGVYSDPYTRAVKNPFGASATNTIPSIKPMMINNNNSNNFNHNPFDHGGSNQRVPMNQMFNTEPITTHPIMPVNSNTMVPTMNYGTTNSVNSSAFAVPSNQMYGMPYNQQQQPQQQSFYNQPNSGFGLGQPSWPMQPTAFSNSIINNNNNNNKNPTTNPWNNNHQTNMNDQSNPFF